MVRRTVSAEACARWRREVASGEALPPDIGHAEGWSRSGVQAHVYGRCQHPGEGVEPPESEDRVDQYPSAEEVWRWRDTRGWAAWSEICAIPPKTVRSYFGRHGWEAEPIRRRSGEGRGAKGSRIVAAPCAECWRKRVPVDDLTGDRLCRECDIGRKAREDAPVDLETEREAYLRRRAG